VHPRRIYLDNAATRFPKPSVVMETMLAYSRSDEAAAGRGAYERSRRASQTVARLRQELATWLDAASDQEISVHPGGTAALNAAIFGVLSPGDHVVTTAAEHNSVLRPLHHLASSNRIEWTVAAADETGRVSSKTVLDAVRPNTRLVAVLHAGNVNGAVQPIKEIASSLGRPGSQRPLLLCDAAQSFGHLPISVTKTAIDLLAAPGHKGGAGPLGTGVLYAAQHVHGQLKPTIYGGTGSQSESLEMPSDYPALMEAGNLNVPALAGWLAGLQSRRGNQPANVCLEASAERLRRIAETLYETLESIEGVQIIGHPGLVQLPVASIAMRGLDASELAMILDGEFGIEVRSGLHCAALIHDAIGSPPGGTLRISASEDTSDDDLNHLAEALTEIAVSST